ncbi:uncharacterized protein DEA37_0003507 [Paragonimus westermani]|uniref:Uncharacterized protein n=1 Tax=Paragonimus westermani TaxID=34504 RepID=A0A5J4NZ42_9TREM|nr:uncharacterized protein DEA37_0003507 [Paragonimus westermani]
MDTSMDDLFSDLDHSNQVPPETDVGKPVSPECLVVHEKAFDEELRITVFKPESLSNALSYEVSLFPSGAKEKKSVKFIAPWCPSLHPSIIFGGSHRVPTDFWPVVRPCVLSLPRTTSTNPRVSVPVCYVSLSWMRVFQQAYRTRGSSSDVHRLLWLLGFPNGLIYQFRLTKQSTFDYTPLFSLTTCEPVVSWVTLNIPTVGDSTVVADLDTNEVVLLVAVGCFGNGVAMFISPEASKSPVHEAHLRFIEFRPPPAPAQLRHIQSHGSWLHLTTTSGHVLSAHFSCVPLQSCQDTAVEANWGVSCELANFPRVPLHMLSVGVKAERAMPRWRYLDLQAFVRLSDGHLGGQQSSGERMRLLDLLCGPDLPEPESLRLPIANLKQTDMIVNCLSDAHHRMNTSVAFLRLLGYPADGQPGEAGHRFREPIKDQLTVDVYLTSNPRVQTSSCLFDLIVLVDVKLASPPVHGTVACLDSLTPEQLASYLLSPDRNALRSTFPDLRLTVRLSPVSREFLDGDSKVGHETHHPSIYCYSEPWFGFGDCFVRERGKTSRRLVLPPTWYASLQQSLEFHKLAGMQVLVYLELSPPALPSILFQPNFSCIKLPTKPFYQVYGPPLPVRIGCRFFDVLHWICPFSLLPNEFQITNSDQTHALSDRTVLTLAYRIRSKTTLNSMLKDITKSHLTTSQMCDSSNFSSIPSGEHCAVCFLPTNQAVTLWWTPLVQSDLATDKCATSLFANAFKLTLSSSCFRTLWSVHLAIEERLRTQSGAHTVCDNSQSTAVTVEDLRVEYGLLKALEHSLQSLRLKKPQCEESEKRSDVANLLSAFCTVRNSIASSWSIG